MDSDNNSAASLTGKVAVVTGASSGIGAAAAAALAKAGARVALIARREALLRTNAETILAAGGSAKIYPADITVPEDVRNVFDRIQQELGPVDILLNAAGFLANVPFLDMNIEIWDQIINTNLRGLMLCCQMAFRQMSPRKSGVIMNISSLSGVKNVEKFPGLSAYTTSKFGVAGLTEALAVEGRPLGIRVVAISPGAVDTPMLKQAAPNLKPLITPENLAELIVYMVGGSGWFLSGTNIELFTNT